MDGLPEEVATGSANKLNKKDMESFHCNLMTKLKNSRRVDRTWTYTSEIAKKGSTFNNYLAGGL